MQSDALEFDGAYEAESFGVTVRVQPQYLEEDSSPSDNDYLWSYHVEIENGSSRTLQLRERFWTITDANGATQTVSGTGVVGQQPVIKPGNRFEYASGCPLNTPSGIMVGYYLMVDTDGTPFEVLIPAFSLDSPYDTARHH